ncbi:LysR family transcriptional regulator [Nitratireductor mangrovi]|uniref:LysR family transcriptional regulator n=1 Tax=Nitratireductor mangrovi TaxID=2599600 RepID=A0A5B8KXV4_9HYPH|nr:hydrogen peroxide-inducible genes activator [Nitratireductor mangrovi]QDZ00379.1 LysR family transcriptional regulator [Nitratireductor mangrovi]
MLKVTLRQMEYFEALAETLHFGRAAALAGVTQPALSVQIAEMEEKLGCRLFERGRSGVRLTEDARSLLPRIDTVLNAARDIEASTRRERLPMTGRFRLGLIPTIAPYLLPRVLPRLKKQFPALRLELREAVTAALVEETAAGKLDAFIAALPIEAPGIVASVLFEDRFFLAVPAADADFDAPPVPPESPALERLMLLEEGHCLREQALAVCGSVKPIAMASYGATSLTTLLQMVAHGLGVTLIPEMALAAGATTRDLKVVPFTAPMPARTICLARRKNSERVQECDALAAAISTVHGKAGVSASRNAQANKRLSAR